MSSVLQTPWTLSAFLDGEERQERPFEFDGFQPVAMNGGTLAHDRISFNIRNTLGHRLKSGRCRPFGPNVKVLAGRSVRYPDVVVSCARQDVASTIVDSPVVVFEVLSRSTSRTDRIVEVRDYLEAASVMRYVIVEQSSIAATVFVRAGAVWQAATLQADDTIDMPEIGAAVPLAEFFVGIDPPGHDEEE